MKDIVVSNSEKINLETWERRDVFNLFKGFTEPYHGVCLRIDCTATYHYAKKYKLSFFLSLVHRSLVAAHQVETFRTRIVKGEAWRYEQIHAGSAVGRKNGTIGLGHYQFHEHLHDFVQEAAIELDRVRGRTDIEHYPEVNLIRYSVLPWFDFTSISHARDLSREDSAPRITFGKMTESGSRRSMPISICVHHALTGGLHVAQFMDHFQAALDSPDLEAGGRSPRPWSSGT